MSSFRLWYRLTAVYILRYLPFVWLGVIAILLPADNLRYCTDLLSFCLYASVVGLGASVSIWILVVAAKGWWKVISIPLCVVFANELLVLIVRIIERG